MRVDRRFLNWGAFFIAMGAVLLVAEGNLVDDQTLSEAWRLWPALIIALGLAIVLRRTRVNLAGGMLMAAVPGLILGGMFAVGPRFVMNCGLGHPGSYAMTGGTFTDRASVTLEASCAEITVNTASGSDWQLESGNSENVAANVTSSGSSLTVSRGHEDRWFSKGKDVWRLTVPTTPTLDMTVGISAGQGTLNLANANLGRLSVKTNAGELKADLSGARLQSIAASVNAGDVRLWLPATGDYSGSLSVNVGSLRFCADPGLKLRIASKVNIGSDKFPGLVRNGDVWQSADYAASGAHADLTTSVNVGSIELNPPGGCQ